MTAPAVAVFLIGLFLCNMAVHAADDLTGFDCLIKPRSVAEVSARGDGVLAKFLVARGDRVKEGQVIASLDSEVEKATLDLSLARARMKAEIAELRESFAFAERELARFAQLVERKAVSYTEKDKAATAAATARLRLERVLEEQQLATLEADRARELLERRQVLSPVDGVVMELLRAVGESVKDHPIARIAEINPLNVELIVPVNFFGRISLGQTGEVLPRYPGALAQHAVVTVVDPIVDAASDTFGVRLKLPNPGGLIPGGVRCEIRFEGMGSMEPVSGPK
jgi:RND family efflux transporter MFP subunit